MLQAQQDAQRKAVFREILATLAEITRQKALDGQGFATAAEEKTYFNDHLNYIKSCTVDPNTEGCWAAVFYSGAPNASGYVLANGASLSSINGSILPNRESIGIDWNGTNPPNLGGEDIITITTCWGPASCAADIVGSRPSGPGAIGPNSGTSATLYDWIFAN